MRRHGDAVRTATAEDAMSHFTKAARCVTPAGMEAHVDSGSTHSVTRRSGGKRPHNTKSRQMTARAEVVVKVALRVFWWAAGRSEREQERLTWYLLLDGALFSLINGDCY